MRVAVVAPQGRVDVDCYESVLRELAARDASVDLVTPSGRPAEGDDGVPLPADRPVREVTEQEYDLFVVIGTAGPHHRLDDPVVEQFLAAVIEEERPVLALCDAIAVLAETGSLEDMEVAACHADMDHVRRQVGSIVDAGHARCGSLVTVCAEEDLIEALHTAIELTAR